ncbi:MAG: aldose epimerase family protein [Sphingobium sp.]
MRAPFGTLPGGEAVEAVTLSNRHGVTARIMTLGATLQSLRTPDRAGHVDEITLGYDDAASYVERRAFFGATIGRYANRIAQGRFTLDGKSYVLRSNLGPHQLHGGPRGLDQRLWSIVSVNSGRDAAVTLRYVSPDGEEGYPGALTVTVRYRLTEGNELKIEYRATTTKPTIVNLSNHAYFNLSGHRNLRPVLDHRLTLAASRYTPVDSTMIPTGELRPVASTPFDFRTATALGAHIRDDDPQLHLAKGYDHNWVLDSVGKGISLAARLEDPLSGRVLEVDTDQPGIQMFTVNYFDGSNIIGRGGIAYRQSDAVCLEAQDFPDAPNHVNFPSTRLDPGQRYSRSIVLRFGTTPAS